MKTLLTLSVFGFMLCTMSAQTAANDQELVIPTKRPINLDRFTNKTGTKMPFTGILYGNYSNGNYQIVQESIDGVGNGKWVDYSPEGIKECEGTYKNNRVEGPVRFFYENGNVKSEGQYLHWKRPIGTWNYYDKKGNHVHTMTYTR